MRSAMRNMEMMKWILMRSKQHTSNRTSKAEVSRMSDPPPFSLTQGYAPAHFQDAEESRPAGAYVESLGGGQDAIQGIVGQTLNRHLAELSPAVSVQASPLLHGLPHGYGNWRKKLRELMIRQDEQMIRFLFLPTSDHSVIGPVEKALSRYAVRHDIESNSVRPLRTLLHDASGGVPVAIAQEIAERCASRGPSTLPQVKAQIQGLLELYKETSDRLAEAEGQLKEKLEKMDKIQRHVSLLMELKTNEATGEIVNALDHYLQVCFRDLRIEPLYIHLLHLYQKQFHLREAITVFRVNNPVTQEPTCSICITEAVNTCVIPCGHTFCGTCAKRMTSDCGICRGKIRERVKIYFA
jgi:hypothetical protein